MTTRTSPGAWRRDTMSSPTIRATPHHPMMSCVRPARRSRIRPTIMKRQRHRSRRRHPAMPTGLPGSLRRRQSSRFASSATSWASFILSRPRQRRSQRRLTGRGRPAERTCSATVGPSGQVCHPTRESLRRDRRCLFQRRRNLIGLELRAEKQLRHIAPPRIAKPRSQRQPSLTAKKKVAHHKAQRGRDEHKLLHHPHCHAGRAR